MFVVCGRPTVKKAELRGGIGMIREANASRRKETGNCACSPTPPRSERVDNWLDTGACPARKGADADQVSL